MIRFLVIIALIVIAWAVGALFVTAIVALTLIFVGPFLSARLCYIRFAPLVWLAS